MADIWDDQYVRPTLAASGSKSVLKPKISNSVVPDDWELDEEEEEEDTGRSVDNHNKGLCEDENAKIHHPMPSLIISRGTSSTSVVSPSLPLNQPPQMRILKRPSPSISPTAFDSTNSGSAVGETLKEREARYHAARERIFGASPNEGQENDDNKKSTRKVVSPPPAASVKLVREPRGPDGSNFDTKGFGERKAQRPPTISSATAHSS